MRSRRRALPLGWYPSTEAETRSLLEAWFAEGIADSAGIAAIAPHAGWAFSGKLAARAIASLSAMETVAVIGGHLPPNAPFLAAYEDTFETALGSLEADRGLREELARQLSLMGEGKEVLVQDNLADNTVEVHLGIIKFLWPESRVLWLRAPNGHRAVDLGRALQRAGAALNRRLVCVGSTDLTHYGPNYGFTPQGEGITAEDWVQKRNDRRFIDAVLALDPGAVLARGNDDHSACSSGAAAAAISFAKESGATAAELLAYDTSLRFHHDASFVGYAAIGIR